MKRIIEKIIKQKVNFILNKKFFCSFNSLKNNSIFFCSDINKDQKNKINKIQNRILITNNKVLNLKKDIIQVIKPNPKLFFFELLNKAYEINEKKVRPKIGNKTKIYENVYLGNNVSIGDNSTIYPGVIISDNVKIGNNCVIKSNSVIGQRGFGVIYNKKNRLIEIPHFGSVVIKNFVEIGALNTIAQGTIDDTFIDSFNKFDDQVHIAHNCFIKKQNTICAGVIFGGSIKLGQNNFIGLNVTIKNKIKIGNNNLIGSGSNIVKNITNKKIVYGNPAK